MLRDRNLIAMSLILAALGLWLGFMVTPANAGIEVSQATIDAVEEGYAVDAQFNVELTPRLEEALNSGVSLYFVVEFELIRPRWYWFDERSVFSRLQYRLTYHALSRQYRLWTGSFHQPFANLAEALRFLGLVRSWLVLRHHQISGGSAYRASVRMRLDTTQLPKPFQLTAITNRDWTLTSDWKQLEFSPPPPATPSPNDDQASPQ